MKGLILLLFIIISTYARAGEADVIKVTFTKHPGNTYDFHVTVRHADTGWDHYADGWEVLDMNGKVLGKRVLYHPHVDEQPFTRSLGGVKIPAGVKKVVVRAHDLVHKYGGKTVIVDLR